MAVTAAGAPPYKAWGSVPGGEQNLLSDLRNQFEYLIGYTKAIPNSVMLSMANARVQTLRDFGTWAADHKLLDTKSYPWAQYGLDKDQYASTASIFAMEFKKVTGQDISSQGLNEAFRNPRDPTGGLLTGSQYQQQLMQDANIQKTYGWVKYGLDYSAWQQQKLSLRTSLGRDISDSEAAPLLQYNTQARGASQTAVASVPKSQPEPGAFGVGQRLHR